MRSEAYLSPWQPTMMEILRKISSLKLAIETLEQGVKYAQS